MSTLRARNVLDLAVVFDVAGHCEQCADEVTCSLEKEANNLQKDAKTYLDAMRCEWFGNLQSCTGQSGNTRHKILYTDGT